MSPPDRTDRTAPTGPPSARRGPSEPPGPGLGALVGLLLAAALASVLFAGHRAWGTPFAPFDLFDGLARVLPGPVVTFGIDAITGAVRFLDLGPTAEAAKAAERALALGLFGAAAAAVGALLFALPRGVGRGPLGATLVGAAVGLGAFLASLAVNPATGDRPVVAGLWLLASFGGWGAAVGWSRVRLAAPTRGPMGADAAPPPSDGAERLDRRRFLVRLGGASAVVTVAGAGVGALVRGDAAPPAAPGDAPPAGWRAGNELPNAGADVRPAPGTRPEYTLPEEHYRIDIVTFAPTIEEADWSLRVDGLVERPASYDLAALRAYEPVHRFVTLSCISNPVGGDLIDTTRWTGVPLARILGDVGLRPDGTHLRISSVDGFFEYLPVATALADPRIMLTYAWDGRPLPRRNGYPLRIFVPDVYGMKQPKWIDRIEVVDQGSAGFWVERGWDAEARVRATSVIDTVATEAVVTDESGRRRVPVGGIAYAGARGIERVEVRVDDGPWREARLRPPLSDLTWVVWRYDWAFEAGEHTLAVRCVDGRGTPQIEAREPVRPAGATGLSSENVSI